MEVDTSLTALFVNFYNGMKKDGVTFIPNSEVAKIVMIGQYKRFIAQKLLIPIELLDIEDKRALADECRLMGIFYDNKTLIENCKILHVINLINQQ